MKNEILFFLVSCLFIQGSLQAGQHFMACVNKNSNGKLIKYGEKRDEKVSSARCKGLWNKHSYRDGDRAVCALKRHRGDRIDYYGLVPVARKQSVADACQVAHPLTAHAM